MLEVPKHIQMSDFKRNKWQEITKNRAFTEADLPVLEMLINWYEIAQQCMSDIQTEGGVQVSYMNAYEDIKQLPQISTLKTASAEIRALNKQLGIIDEHIQEKPKEVTVLSVIKGRRNGRARAANQD